MEIIIWCSKKNQSHVDEWMIWANLVALGADILCLSVDYHERLAKPLGKIMGALPSPL
jgi:hypothetical protein